MALQHVYGQISDRNEEACLWQRTVSAGRLEVLLLADDLVMLAEAEEALQHNLQEANDKVE